MENKLAAKDVVTEELSLEEDELAPAELKDFVSCSG